MIYQVVGSYDNELQEVELKQFFSKDNALEYAEWIASFFDFDSVLLRIELPAQFIL